ncbi:MAG: hypothetical protein ACETWG_07460 [Candidatus Neomarinimicrobiota bacterium]
MPRLLLLIITFMTTVGVVPAQPPLVNFLGPIPGYTARPQARSWALGVELSGGVVASFYDTLGTVHRFPENKGYDQLASLRLNMGYAFSDIIGIRIRLPFILAQGPLRDPLDGSVLDSGVGSGDTGLGDAVLEGYLVLRSDLNGSGMLLIKVKAPTGSTPIELEGTGRTSTGTGQTDLEFMGVADLAINNRLLASIAGSYTRRLEGRHPDYVETFDPGDRIAANGRLSMRLTPLLALGIDLHYAKSFYDWRIAKAYGQETEAIEHSDSEAVCVTPMIGGMFTWGKLTTVLLGAYTLDLRGLNRTKVECVTLSAQFYCLR